MNFVLASLVWIIIGTLLGVGLWLAAAKGTLWLLIAAIVGFVFAVGAIGCKVDH